MQRSRSTELTSATELTSKSRSCNTDIGLSNKQEQQQRQENIQTHFQLLLFTLVNTLHSITIGINTIMNTDR